MIVEYDYASSEDGFVQAWNLSESPISNPPTVQAYWGVPLFPERTLFSERALFPCERENQ